MIVMKYNNVNKCWNVTYFAIIPWEPRKTLAFVATYAVKTHSIVPTRWTKALVNVWKKSINFDNLRWQNIAKYDDVIDTYGD